MREVAFPLRRVVTLFTAAYALLVLLGIASNAVRTGLGHDYALGFVPMFNLSAERNLPTWASGLGLVFCAALSWLASVEARGNGTSDAAHWRWCAGILAYLATDEVAVIHDRVNRIFETHIAPGRFTVWWAVPALLVAAVVAWRLLPFVLRQAPPLRRRLLLAGALYVGAAAGLELIGGVVRMDPARFVPYSWLEVLEEAIEMGAVLLAMHAITGHLADRRERLVLQLLLRDAAPAAARAGAYVFPAVSGPRRESPSRR